MHARKASPCSAPNSASTPLLFVAQAAVTNHTGLIARAALTMPAAPFGSPAWQLPALVFYLHHLHQDEEDPSPDLWRAHTERLTGPVPRPHIRYQADGLHDANAVCVLDIQLGPRNEDGWPAAGLAVIEQEEGACPFGRITHHHGIEAIAAYAAYAQELTAEHAALMDHARQHQDASFVRLAELAQRATARADNVRAAAHTDALHVQPNTPGPASPTDRPAHPHRIPPLETCTMNESEPASSTYAIRDAMVEHHLRGRNSRRANLPGHYRPTLHTRRLHGRLEAALAAPSPTGPARICTARISTHTPAPVTSRILDTVTRYAPALQAAVFGGLQGLGEPGRS